MTPSAVSSVPCSRRRQRDMQRRSHNLGSQSARDERGLGVAPTPRPPVTLHAPALRQRGSTSKAFRDSTANAQGDGRSFGTRSGYRNLILPHMGLPP